ncbi:MAG: type II secretion system protein GspG [Spirochaetales bacterium]|nr:type II secretion system protein GspG [Spirochaetales bacterium]
MKIMQSVREWIKRHFQAVKSLDKSSGATFVEIIVTVTIILILMGAITAGTFFFIDKANVARAIADISSLKTAVTAYGMANKFKYPSEGDWQTALMPYLEGQPIGTDPWGNDYIYKCPGPNNKPYEIKSLGSDGEEGGEGSAADLTS